MVIRYKKLENKYENKLALYINLMMIIDIIRRCFNLFDLTFVYDTEVQAILYICLHLCLSENIRIVKSC